MTATPTRLRFCPYMPPSFKRGDHTFCLYRDADVVVTGWTDARISWPRCRALHQRGGAGLLITDELRRAILSESAAALKHWYGVSTKAVWNWRRAFGVAALGTPGSQALREELNAELAANLRGRSLSRAARDRRRRTARELNLGQHLDTARTRRWLGKNWTAEKKALLGTLPDADLAKRFGRSETAVRVRRTKLGILTAHDRRMSKPSNPNGIQPPVRYQVSGSKTP